MYNSLFKLFFLLLVWFFLPILSIAILPLFLTLKSKSKNLESLIIILLISISIGLIAFVSSGSAGKLHDSDIERYYITYEQFSSMDFNRFLATRLLLNPNIIFDTITFFISQLFPNRPQAMSLFWIGLTYFLSLLSIKILMKGFRYRIGDYYPYIVLMFIFVFSNYTFSSDLVKQATATSIFSLGLFNYILNNKKWGYLLLVIAILTHSSIIILSPIFFLNNYFKKHKASTTIIFSIIAFAIVSNLYLVAEILLSIDLRYLQTLGEKAALVSGDVVKWRIHYFHIIGLILLIIISYAQRIYYAELLKYSSINTFLQKEVRLFENLRNIFMLGIIVMLANIINTHNFLRFFNTLSVFYIIPLVLFKIHGRAIRHNSPKKEKLYIITAYVLFFSFYVSLNFYNRTIDPRRAYGVIIMENDLLALLSSSVYELLNFYN